MLPDNILIIIPHPDDEILLTAGVIRRAIKEGKKVRIVIVTNGDYLCHNHEKGSRRLGESVNALTLLGVPQEDMFFLGYPDTGMEPEISFISTLWNETDGKKIHPATSSSHTYGIIGGRQDYHMEQLGNHALYNKENFETDLLLLLNSYNPNLVITTSCYDLHGDHSGLSLFVREAIKKRSPLSPRPILWEGLVHSLAGDLCWPLPGDAYSLFTMPKGIDWPTKQMWEDRIRVPLLQEDMDTSIKYKAILCHATALNPNEPEVIDYLLSFAKGEEIFFQIQL